MLHHENTSVHTGETWRTSLPVLFTTRCMMGNEGSGVSGLKVSFSNICMQRITRIKLATLCEFLMSGIKINQNHNVRMITELILVCAGSVSLSLSV